MHMYCVDFAAAEIVCKDMNSVFERGEPFLKSTDRSQRLLFHFQFPECTYVQRIDVKSSRRIRSVSRLAQEKGTLP